MIRRISRSSVFGLGALLLASASVVSAQYAERPADRLSRYLRELSGNPTSLSGLIGAGQASLDVGDGHAALGFFARADERSPRNGQVKAGLARAMLLTDKPREALQLFEEARRFGVGDPQIAGDRGLAYDLRGDARRAQQDYALALRGGANDEVTKRYALSLGITGDRDQALKLLDPLLYKRDQGAWRARAFVLAMNGDTRGASAIVHQVMPQRMAQSMDQFLGKLAGLNAEQKAAAVHLGEIPTNVRFAANTVAQPAFVAPAPSPTPAPSARPTPRVREPRRRPAASLPLASPPPAKVVRALETSTPAPAPSPTPAPVQLARTEVASYPPVAAATTTPARSITPAPTQTDRGDLEAIMREIREAAARPLPTPRPTVTPTPRPTRVAIAQVKPAPTPTPKASPTPIAKKAADKPDPKLKPSTKTDPKSIAKKKAEEPKHPPRIWVQVAGGANLAGLPKEWTSLSGKAPEMKSKGPWTAKNRATNRLLTGPYKTAAEAQAAVSRLRKAGVGAFQWTSEEGEIVSKLGGK